MSFDPRAVTAASNNADLYEAMFTAHGLRHTRLPFAFVGQDAPPPYYSNLTILAPNHQAECRDQLARLAKAFTGRVGLKDSFCQMELEGDGFETLFKATWLWRAPCGSAEFSDWHRVDSAGDLHLWEQAWKAAGSPTTQRMFLPSLLSNPDIFFLGRKVDGAFQSGCIANISTDCIGLSNVFAASPSATVYRQAAEAVAAFDPEKPIVGYESGHDLDRAQAAGFETTGPLRILTAENARF